MPHQNTERHRASVAWICAHARLVNVAIVTIPNAHNSPRFCCNVRLMTFSSIGLPPFWLTATDLKVAHYIQTAQAEDCATESAGALLAKRSGGMGYDFAGCSGLGALSPIRRTLPSKSDICMPESASKRAGTCAAIFATSPVSL